MRIAVLSDVHGNLPALEAVLADARDCDTVWNLGDTVGYGPDPVACIERLGEARPAVTLVGNHDLAGIGALDVSQFNAVARIATEWTARQLAGWPRDWIASLPRTAVRGDATLAHGSPRSPVWEYILSTDVAADNMGAFSTALCLVGHTHVAAVARQSATTGKVQFGAARAGQVLDLTADRWIVNPGSVGQPRDADPRAGYLVYDDQAATIELRRVPYPVAVTQRAIVVAGLPEVLASRLALGR